jgi:hypothetical protein
MLVSLRLYPEFLIRHHYMPLIANLRPVLILHLCLLFLAASPQLYAQKKQPPTSAAPPQLIKRTIIKHATARVGYGSTITLVGAPKGAVSIEGWDRSEVELTAEIELQGENEEDLNRLALVNGSIFEEAPNHIRILSVGTHDKKYLRRVAKDFPKKLLLLPWKIDYRIRVPQISDLEINAGRGPISLSGVEGSLALTATESDAQLTLSSGIVNITIGSGKVKLKIPVRSWRGTGADVRLAAGELTVELSPGFSADVDATVLRLGKIEDSYGELQPRQRDSITPQLIRARAGAGGPIFRFTVGDGTIILKKH